MEEIGQPRRLAWLPIASFTSPLQLIVSTLPDADGVNGPAAALSKHQLKQITVTPFRPAEIANAARSYANRHSQELEDHHIEQLQSAPGASNPLYLKIVLDELRITGRHDVFSTDLAQYLEMPDVVALMVKVFQRYETSYEPLRPGLVGESLALIYSSRRGLRENELVELLAAPGKRRLPASIWAPFFSALKNITLVKSDALTFAHAQFSDAVWRHYIGSEEKLREVRLQLAGYFERAPARQRSGDELPWLLEKAGDPDRLEKCLTNIDLFVEIRKRDAAELQRYWVQVLRKQPSMPRAYREAYDYWIVAVASQPTRAFSACSRLGNFLEDNAAFIDTEYFCREGLKYAEKTRSITNIATALNNLAMVYKSTNRLTEAEPIFRRVLAICEASYGPKHPNVATRLNNLAELLRATNRFAEAEPLYRRALAIDEANLGPDHARVAGHLNNLALLLEATNRLAEAEPLYRRALAICEASYGPEHPGIATCLNNMAGLLRATNRLAEAELMCRRALAIGEASFGPDHPKVATRLNNLASLLASTNRLMEAETLYRRALAINEASFGPDHPDVATCLNNLAGSLRVTNRLAEAEPLLRRALAIDEASLGPDHPSVATDLNNLAHLLVLTNRLAEAGPLFLRALAIDEASLGPDHPDVATGLNNLAWLLNTTNRPAEAEPLYRRALAINEASYGPDHPNVAIHLNNLAELLEATNRLAEAEPLYRRALAIDEASYGPDHPCVARDLNNLAVLLHGANRLAEAVPLSRRHLDILVKFTRATGHRHPHLQIASKNYTYLLTEKGRTEQEVWLTLREIAPDLFG